MRLAGKSLKLSTRLIIIYFLTILLPIVVISQVVTYISGNKIANQATELAQENTRQLNRNLRSLLNDYIGIIKRIAYYDNVLKSYLSVSRKYGSVLESVDAYNSYLKMIDFYSLNGNNAAGQLRIYYLNNTLLQDVSTFVYATDSIRESMPYSQAILADGAIAWGISAASHGIIASCMIKDSNGQEIGVIAIEIPEEKLYSLIQETNSQEKQIIICDETGQVISCNSNNLVGSTIGKESYFAELSHSDHGIFDSGVKNKDKVLYESIKTNNQYPDWKIVTRIPVGTLLSDANNIRIISLQLLLVSFILSMTLFILSSNQITNRVKRLIKKMDHVKDGNFDILDNPNPTDEIGVLIENFNNMTRSLDTLINENLTTKLQLSDIALKKREAELYALQSQINPHFLFNTLESIRMKLSNSNADRQEAARMIFNLSKILRMSLNWQGEIIHLSDEIDFVKSYLEIIKGRYWDKLTYSIDIPDTIMDSLIPKLTIQPIVENAIRHGLEPTSRPGHISISAVQIDEDMKITIMDNGVGMDAFLVSKIREELRIAEIMKNSGSIGMRNVNDRIKLHYGSGYGLSVESEEGKGTVVQLVIPVQKELKNV